MAMGTLVCFGCCYEDQPQPKRRRRIDRTMIGEPMNFRHTAHVGSGDVSTSSSGLSDIQGQMSSKGETEHCLSSVAIHLNVIDLPARKNS